MSLIKRLEAPSLKAPRRPCNRNWARASRSSESWSPWDKEPSAKVVPRWSVRMCFCSFKLGHLGGEVGQVPFERRSVRGAFHRNLRQEKRGKTVRFGRVDEEKLFHLSFWNLRPIMAASAEPFCHLPGLNPSALHFSPCAWHSASTCTPLAFQTCWQRLSFMFFPWMVRSFLS